VLCLLACWVEDPNSEAYMFHLARLKDYFRIAEDGLKIQVIIMKFNAFYLKVFYVKL